MFLKVTLTWLRMVYSCWHNDRTKKAEVMLK
jgi:hypothetical protein